MNIEGKLDALLGKVDCLVKQIKFITATIAISTILVIMTMCHVLNSVGIQ